jgi:hypothetical protein
MVGRLDLRVGVVGGMVHPIVHGEVSGVIVTVHTGGRQGPGGGSECGFNFGGKF